MRTPSTRAEQRFARCRGELLRGCGIWPAWGSISPLEPPFEPFDWSNITRWDLCINGFSRPYQGQWIDRLKRLFLPAPAPPRQLYPDAKDRLEPLHVVTVAPYLGDEVAYTKAEQLILALGSARSPVTFELFAIGKSRRPDEQGERIEIRFVTHDADLLLIQSQLHAHFPRASIVGHPFGEKPADQAWQNRLNNGNEQDDPVFSVPLYLDRFYCFPIRTYSNFSIDPLGTVLAVMDELRPDEWALLQVMFSRAEHAWADNLNLACHDPYQKGQFMIDGLDRSTLHEKLQLPFYAVSITLAANRSEILSRLSAFVHQFESPHNQLAMRDAAAWASQWSDNTCPPEFDWRWAIAQREPLVPGMLLNAAELTGIVHLPNPDVPTERLLRVTCQTRQSPKANPNAGSVVIGRNIHRGREREVAIPADVRLRHCYVAGASGTGKSTLLQRMILHDIGSGRGVGLLDPHGDLVKAVLRHIPKDRIGDVILFDAADTEYPFALNILEARDQAEQERIVAETVMALERYFPASWGPRLERILQFTLRTVLHAVPGATLADVEQMLTDENYREAVLESATDSRMLQFWRSQFPLLPKNSVDPVLNKLSVFLLDRHVRNIICQRRSAIDFDQLLNEGKILLANLSTGLLTEKVAGTLGSFLVTKIVNAAFRRAAIPESKRRPWFLYVDEFQNFMNLSIGFERILAESRKFALGLCCANQFIGQVSPAVRQAIFGNVGSMIVFRLGIDDAHTVAKELGVFTADDLLNLDVGQAIARSGGSSSAHNLQTYPPPAVVNDPTQHIVGLAHQQYAKPRRDVERDLAQITKAVERPRMAANRTDEPADPNEDDLVV